MLYDENSHKRSIPIQCICVEPGAEGDGKTGRKKDVEHSAWGQLVCPM